MTDSCTLQPIITARPPKYNMSLPSKTIVIDCSRARDAAAVHRALARQLRFPPHYGGNLDALRDCLSETIIEYRLHIRWHDTPSSRSDPSLQNIKKIIIEFCKIYYA